MLLSIWCVWNRFWLWNFLSWWPKCFWWASPARKSTCRTPKKTRSSCPFQFRLAISLGDSPKLPRRIRRILAAISIPSTYWAHWSSLTTWSNYSRFKLENADTDLLRSPASLLQVCVLLAKLKASSSIDRWSIICKEWKAWGNWACRKATSLSGNVLHLKKSLLGDCS